MGGPPKIQEASQRFQPAVIPSLSSHLFKPLKKLLMICSQWPWEAGEWERFWEAVQRRPPSAIRLKRGFPRPDLWPDGEPVPWHPEGRWCQRGEENLSGISSRSVRLGESLVYAAGGFYIQDAASLLAVTLLDAKPGERICDLCAAPGGKSTAILEALAGDGWLLANEPVRSRWGALQFNLARHGATNYVLSQADPETLAQRLAGQFDAVLVDAPCSGQSLLGRKKQTEAAFQDPTVAHCAARQERILAAAQRLVRPGGRLVYSTCTFAPAENELQIEAFLNQWSGWSLEPDERLATWQSRLLPQTYRLWPHLHACGGTFAARLVRHADAAQEQLAGAEAADAAWSREACELASSASAEGPGKEERRELAKEKLSRQASDSTSRRKSRHHGARSGEQRSGRDDFFELDDDGVEGQRSRTKQPRKLRSAPVDATVSRNQEQAAAHWQACSLPTGLEEWGRFSSPPIVWGNGVQQFAWPHPVWEPLLAVGLAGPEVAFRKGDTWFPAYALAMRWDDTWQPRAVLPLDDLLARAYLRGEAIVGSARGWCLATWQGLPLGWLKGDGQSMKNHLPKPGRCGPG